MSISQHDALCQISQFQQSQEVNVDLIGVPVKRTRTEEMGAVNTNRFKSHHERCVKKKDPRSCTLCGQEGHYSSGDCKRWKDFGTLVREDDIDSLVQDLIRCSSPLFNPVEIIPVGSHLMEQVNPETNYMVIHNYASKETADDSKESSREDASYLCVTQIFEMGVTRPLSEKCLVRTAKVTAWITKTKMNRRCVIMCKLKHEINS